MAYADLREYLAVLEKNGKLRRVKKEVEKDWELAAVCRQLFKKIPAEKRPAVMFDNVKGFDIPVVAGALGASKDIYAVGLETDSLEGINRKWDHALEHPIPPRMVKIGPCKENILRDQEVNILKLPVPTWTVGEDPAIGYVSVSKMSDTLDEFAVAGGLRGEPVDLVPCETVPLEVPATAEIVLEGEIPPNALEHEGPFGEYTGYMGPAGNEPFFNIKCMTFRNNTIYQAFISQMPPSESSCIRGVGREWPLFKHLKDTLRIPIKDLRLKEAGGSGAYLVISLKKQFDGQVRQLMYGAWSQRTGFGKITVVVDDDIDVWDDFAVDWALSWHVRPDKDIYIERYVQAVGLDPSQAPASVLQHHPSRYVGSRLAIDATRKHEYPAISLPPKEHLDLVASHWRDYGVED